MFLLLLPNLNTILQEKYNRLDMLSPVVQGGEKALLKLSWPMVCSDGEVRDLETFGSKSQDKAIRSSSPQKINVWPKPLLDISSVMSFLPCTWGQHRVSQHVRGHEVPPQGACFI